MVKKGQATIFVIIGIILVVIIGFAVFAVNMIQLEKEKTQIRNTVNQALSDGAVNNYVSDCMKRVTQNGVKTILLQGGKLYNKDYLYNIDPNENLAIGQNFLPFNYSNDTVKVAYAIIPNTECNATRYFLEPPYYPFPNKKLSAVIINNSYIIPQIYYDYNNSLGLVLGNRYCAYNRKDSGFFGLNNLTRLCTKTGPNFNLELIQNPDYGPELASFVSTCSYYERSLEETTFEEQLNEYLKQHLPMCTNFTEFNSRNSGKVQILSDPEEIKVVFGSDTILTEATYRFKVQLEGSQKTAFERFASIQDINLQNLYSCAFKIIKQDSQNIFFNKSMHISKIASCNGFVYTEYREACPMCENASNDDIIKITDPSSLIDGQPLTFLLAIKNRRPALDLIRDPTYQQYNLTSDLQFMLNETIILEPEGYDPDELSLTYNYSLWRETYTDIFNITCCAEAGIGGTVNCSVNISECMIHDYTIEPKNWTNSESFTATQKNAEYHTLPMDAGLHEVRIDVWDRENLLDFQTVRILVFDLPIARINTSNYYDDIPNNISSIEDPFLFIANQSTKSVLLSNQNLTEYLWKDFTEPFSKNTSKASISLPFNPYSINNSQFLLDIKYKNFTKTGMHNLSLTVGQSSYLGILHSYPVYKQINVLQCLPHSSTAAPWPYNDKGFGQYTIEEDPFQADHVCCNDGMSEPYGTIKDSYNVCFVHKTYGSYYSFNETYSVPYDAEFPDGSPMVSYIFVNDIYKREFERTCSGTRGNICTGPYTDTRPIHEVCNGYVTGNSESCSGPGITYYTENPIGCVDYLTGDSFELRFNLKKSPLSITAGQPANGICDDKYSCATGEGGIMEIQLPSASSTKTPFKCKGQCDGEGNCYYPSWCLCSSQPDQYGTSCDGDSQCNNQLPGYAYGSGAKMEKGCSDVCGEVSCSPYIFNTLTLGCFDRTTTNSDNECDDNFLRDPPGGNCVGGVTGSGKESSGDYDSVNSCESLFGADSQCDEKKPETNQCSGRILVSSCDANCQYNYYNVCSTQCGATSTCNNQAPNTCHTALQNTRCTSSCTAITDYTC